MLDKIATFFESKFFLSIVDLWSAFVFALGVPLFMRWLNVGLDAGTFVGVVLLSGVSYTLCVEWLSNEHGPRLTGGARWLLILLMGALGSQVLLLVCLCIGAGFVGAAGGFLAVLILVWLGKQVLNFLAMMMRG
ncbi:MAG: hypothetical protein K2X27_07260 [Candidatus Obscuribacterales bacterium]|nr:hypothetical protein [Candidatus Obscuribacterales bacterium]